MQIQPERAVQLQASGVRDFRQGNLPVSLELILPVRGRIQNEYDEPRGTVHFPSATI